MSENDLKPSLRFKGFTDAWKQRKLGELGTFASNGVDKKIRSNEYPVNLLNYMDVYKRREITNKNIRILMRVTAKKEQIEKNNVLKNDIFFTPTSETADDVGHAMVITETLKNTVYSYHLMRYRPFENEFYSTFPNFCFDTNRFHNQCTLNAQGVQRFVISKPVFENLTVNVPTYMEQEKIASLLTDLDFTITLHQHKYEKLQNVKMFLLGKMFPDETSDKPKIRFNGYTDVWEQRKFDDVVSRIGTGLNPRQNFTLNTGGKNYYVTIKNFQHGQLYLDDKCDLVDDEALKLIQNRSDLQVNDILFASIGRIGDCYLIDSKPKKWNINESVFTLRPNTNIIEPKYLFHTIHSNKVLDQISNNTTGSTFKSIKVNDLKKIGIPTPSKEEQKGLADVLSNLDTLITLHQHKYEKLQNIKKSLLERMFV